jgi:FAD/FMN-containing dehydrogenase
MVFVGIDADPEKVGALKHWCRAYWEAVHPYTIGAGYVNFMMGDEGEGRLRATYGDNYQRLVALKDKFDPTNLFRVNQNIEPRTRRGEKRPAA